MGPNVVETAADGTPEFFSGAKPAVQPNESLVQTFLRDECHDDGSETKRNGGMSCSKLLSGEFECAVGVNLATEHTELVQPC